MKRIRKNWLDTFDVTSVDVEALDALKRQNRDAYWKMKTAGLLRSHVFRYVKNPTRRVLWASTVRGPYRAQA